MPLATARLNAAVDAALSGISHLAVLDATLTEITGGSPAYARQTVSWAAAASALADNSASRTFNVATGLTVAFLGFETTLSSGTGSTAGWVPIGGASPQIGIVAASDDTVLSKAHGLTTNDRVVFMDMLGGGVPAGITEGTLYHVIATGLTTDAFKFSTTSGGSAVNVTADGEMFFTKVVPQTFSAQGTLTVATGDLDVIGNVL